MSHDLHALGQAIQTALAQHQAGRSAEALASLRKLKKKARGVATLYDAEATILVSLGQFSEALAVANARLRVLNNANGLKNQAICLEKLGRFAEAARSYKSIARQLSDREAAKRCIACEIKAGDITSLPMLQEKHQLFAQLVAPIDLLDICWESENDRLLVELARSGYALDVSNPDNYRKHAWLQLKEQDAHTGEFLAAYLQQYPNDMDMAAAHTALLRVEGRGDEALQRLRALVGNHYPVVGELQVYWRTTLLSLGKFAEAADTFDLSIPTSLNRRLPKVPLPFGQPDTLAGLDRRYIVYMEEGVGDQIRNFSLVEQAYAAGCRFALGCEERLAAFYKAFCPELKFFLTDRPVVLEGEQALMASFQLMKLLAAEKGYPETVRVTPQRRRLTTLSLPQKAKPRIGVTFGSATRQRFRENWYARPEHIVAALQGYGCEIYVLDSDVAPTVVSTLQGAGHDVVTAAQVGVNARDDFCSMHDLLQELDFCIIPPVSLLYQACFAGTHVVYLAAEGFDRWSVSEPYLRSLYPNIDYIRRAPWESWDEKADVTREAVGRQLRVLA